MRFFEGWVKVLFFDLIFFLENVVRFFSTWEGNVISKGVFLFFFCLGMEKLRIGGWEVVVVSWVVFREKRNIDIEVVRFI